MLQAVRRKRQSSKPVRQIELAEGGSRGVTVTLDSEPAETVAVETRTGDGLRFTPVVRREAEQRPESLTITIEALDDSVAEGNKTVEINAWTYPVPRPATAATLISCSARRPSGRRLGIRHGRIRELGRATGVE